MAYDINNSYEELFEGTTLPNERVSDRKSAEAALKVKIALESIEQQKRISGLQESILGQQKKLSDQTGKLGKATWVLAFATCFLLVAAAFNAFFLYKGYEGSMAQTEAIGNLEASLQKIPPVITKLAKATEKQVSEMKKLNAGIKFIATVMPKSETFKELEGRKKHSSSQRRALGLQNE